jgi:hypothetical protein
MLLFYAAAWAAAGAAAGAPQDPNSLVLYMPGAITALKAMRLG